MQVKLPRRVLLAWLGVAGAGLLLRAPVLRAERNRAAFDAEALPATLDALLGGGEPVQHAGIRITAPPLIEDGGFVPVEVEVELAQRVSAIAILAERNPNPLIARYALGKGTLPYIDTRIKMAETAAVVAIAETAAGAFFNRREVEVIIGGCGPGT